MTTPEVSLITDSGRLSIPDCWEALSPETYLAVIKSLIDFRDGRIPPMEVKTAYVRLALTERGHKPRTPDDFCDVIALAEKITFPFRIQYDNEDLLSTLSPEQRKQMRLTDPHRLNFPVARAIAEKGAYSYTLNSCFCAQLLPSIQLDGETFHGYEIRRDYDMLTTNMTALQYLDARSLIDHPEAMPLMAAVLYCPAPYAPEKAHALAVRFEHVDTVTLSAIQLCFIAFNNYLLTRTHFSILQDGGNQKKPRKAPLISTGPIEALYSLASSGYGNLDQVEQMNVIKYLTLMRKQLIESVHAMNASGMKITEIADKSGLSFDTLNKILQ